MAKFLAKQEVLQIVIVVLVLVHLLQISCDLLQQCSALFGLLFQLSN